VWFCRYLHSASRARGRSIDEFSRQFQEEHRQLRETDVEKPHNDITNEAIDDIEVVA
jgi:hypothetical protein